MTKVICEMNLNVYFHALLFENLNEASGDSHGIQKIDLVEPYEYFSNSIERYLDELEVSKYPTVLSQGDN